MAITIKNPFGGNSTPAVKKPTTTYKPAYPAVNAQANQATAQTRAALNFINRYQTNPPPTVKTTGGGTSLSNAGVRAASTASSAGGGGSAVRAASSGGSSGSSGSLSGGSSSGGGSANTSEGINQNFTGWAAGPYGNGIKPDMAVQLMENPDAFLRQVMFINGYDPDRDLGIAGSASPYIQDMNQLALIMLGANPGYGSGDLNTTLNWMGNFVNQGLTPGGEYLNFQQGLNNLTANGGGSNATPLYSHLTNNLTSQGQASEFLGLASALANASLHPLWARAFQDEVRRQGDAYVSKSAANQMDNFPEWIRGRLGL